MLIKLVKKIVRFALIKLYYYQGYFHYLFLSRKEIFVLGSPEYENLGDSAITLSQLMFLYKCGYGNDSVEEVTQSDYLKYESIINLKTKDSLICGVGGGNMGNVWPVEEQFRYSFMDNNVNNRIVIFPQTISYTDDKYGNTAMHESISHYESCTDLTLVARESKSFELMEKIYPTRKVLLTPDIVLSSNMEDYGINVRNRDGVLCVFRNDIEKAVDDSEINRILDYITKSKLSIKVTDMYSDGPVTKKNRYELVSNKMQEFADSKLIITDRLHGMIFAAITETPCIVFSNNNHKVKGTYEWIKHLDYIKYVETAEEAITLIPELLKLENCHYDIENILPLYDDLKNEISGWKNK